MRMEQHEVDKVNKDKSNKVVPKGFWVEVFFASEDGSETYQEEAAPEPTPSSTSSAAVEGEEVKHSDLLEKCPMLNNL